MHKESGSIQVWDLPIRLVHWLLVLLLGFSWWSAAQDQMQWHRYSGLAILTLVLFRIYWGIVGPVTARFSNFIHGPAAVAQYAKTLFKRRSIWIVGHNPLGGWSAALLLFLLLLQTLLGLFAVDVDGIESGPLSYLVSFEIGRIAARMHGRVFDALKVVIALHLAAVSFYQLYKRQNLLGSMVHGKRSIIVASLAAAQHSTHTRWGIAFAGILFAGLLVLFVGNGFRW